MSEYTQCNYCKLKEMKRNKPKGSRIILRRTNEMGLGGIDVFLVLKGEKLDTRTPNNGGKHWKRWFMALGDRCEC